VLAVVGKGRAWVMLPLAPEPFAQSMPRWAGAAMGRCCCPWPAAGWDRHEAARIVRRLARRAGLGKPIGPHSLRHTMVTLAPGCRRAAARRPGRCRHADPPTTRRYDRGRHSLDRHATYQLAAFLAEVAPPTCGDHLS
jgi:integrase